MFVPFKTFLRDRLMAFVRYVVHAEMDEAVRVLSVQVGSLRADCDALRVDSDALGAAVGKTNGRLFEEIHRTESLEKSVRALEFDIKAAVGKTDGRLFEEIHRTESLEKSVRALEFDIKSGVQAKLKGVYENMDFRLRKRDGGKSSRRVVYTCIAGNYDVLPPPEFVDCSWDYVCFTDSPELLRLEYFGVWQIRFLKFAESDNVRNNRWHKTHPHVLFPDYDESIYVDSSFTIRSGWIFDEIRKRKSEASILIPLHFHRDCAYDELETVAELALDDAAALRKHRDFLEREGFPRHYGLNENCLIYRRHTNPEVVRMMEDWWILVRDLSRRDQLSLPFVLWKHGVKPADIALPSLRTRYRDFQFTRHVQPFSPVVEIPEDYRWEEADFPHDVNCRNTSLDRSEISGWAFLPGRSCTTAVATRNNIFYSDLPVAAMLDSSTKDTRTFRPKVFKAGVVSRPDVQKAFGLPSDKVGFSVEADTYLGSFRLCLVDDAEKKVFYSDYACPTP